MAERGKIAGDLFVLQHKERVQPLMVSIFYWIETILMMAAFIVPWKILFNINGIIENIFGIILFFFWLFWIGSRILNRNAIIEQKIWLQNNAKLRAPEGLNT